jgi:hypothetical protein
MYEIPKKTGYGRLEDFIIISRDGMDVGVEVELRKEIITQKVHPEETETMISEVKMSLLIGEYTFRFEGVESKVSKAYMYGSAEESREASEVDRNIANARLKMDYQRLHEANINFEEKYF